MSMSFSAWRPGRLAAAACCLLALSTAAGAQIVGSGAPAAGGSALTGMGQSPSFENVTTTFQGIAFRTRALIRDPADKTRFRLIAQLENTGSKDVFVALLWPAALLVDDMANVYERAGETGVTYCLDGGSITDRKQKCHPNYSLKLPPGMPAPVSFVFAPHGDGAFQPELAALASILRLSVTFAISSEDFDNYNNTLVHEVQVTGLPIPQ